MFEVPAILTQPTRAEARQYLTDALTAELGQAPSTDTVALLMAQVGQETYGDFHALFCHNFGNITTDGSWLTVYFKLNHRDARENANKYRAYPTFTDGARDMVSFLKSRYRSAWKYLLTGEPEPYVAALKSAGYFGGDLGIYTRNVRTLYNQFGGKVPPPLSVAAASSSWERLPRLSRGHSGEVVKVVQAVVGAEVDGVFGDLTLARVREWQGSHGLDPDGIVGPLTWQKLLQRTK